MNKEKKFMYIGIFILLITLVGASSTYAWFTWSSTNNTSITMSIGESSEVVFASGNDITTSSLAPVFNYTDGEDTSFKIVNKGNTSIDYKVILNITSIDNELKSDSLKYVLVKDNTIIKEDSFTNITTGNTTLYESSITGSSNNFIFYLYIDGNTENDLSMMNKNITGTITVEASLPSVNLATYVTNLYTSSSKTTTEVNSITYNLASSVSLMNDRLGSSSVNANSGNIRYYGANPNNYIYFNCSDYSNQSSSTCEKWRIIGVFNGKVKIMRNETIGQYSWDGKYDNETASIGSNNWIQADTMMLLNSGYESQSVGGSLYWNSSSGTCYNGRSSTGSCNFESTGLKNIQTKNLITEVTYYLRDGEYDSYVGTVYNNERTNGGVYRSNSPSWNGKIALPYLSDYGYSADLSSCKQTLYNYNDSTCSSNNWMLNIITNGLTTTGWLLGHSTQTGGGIAYFVSGSGVSSTKGYTSGTNTYKANNVLPVLYLIENINILSDSIGSSTDPFKIVI